MAIVSYDRSTGRPNLPKIRETFHCLPWSAGDRPGIKCLKCGTSSDSKCENSIVSLASSYKAFIPSGNALQQSIGASWYGQLTGTIVMTNPSGLQTRASSRIQIQGRSEEPSCRERV